MRLERGSRLGRLEILDLLGSGGMGEVYRAHDPDLEREVAVKVILSETASDPVRIERLEREARAVGRLNHPNLLAIHDIGRHEDSPYLVCELLDGVTLRQRLRSGPLPLAELLSCAVQIASGLAAAHEQGVVHRDLKPENVMVTRSGTVKILDFGLAKLTEGTLGAEGGSATLTALTASGSVIGTAAYMSPEQIAGRTVDERSDQFALGLILHEMLCGSHPFERGTVPEMMTAILKDEPPTLERSAAPVPLRWIVERCLEKDPARRYAATSDLARDLEILRDRHRELARVEPGPSRARRSRWPFALIGVLALILAAGLTLVGRRDAPIPQLRFEQLTFRRGTVSAARFDADGESVLYSASWDGQPTRLHLMTPGTPDPILVGPPGSILMSVSPQRELLLTTERQASGPFLRWGTLARMPVTGAPRAFEERISEATWGPDGEVLALVRDVEQQSILESPPGRQLYTTRGMIWHLRASPDGRRLAFVEVPYRGTNFGPVVIMGTDGERREVGTSGDLQGLDWSPNGEEVWFGRGNSIVAIDDRGGERTVATFPQRVVLHDVAPDGRVLLAVEPSRWEMVGRASATSEERDLSWLSYSLPFAISPDRSRILFNECSTGACTIGLRNFDRDPPVLLGRGFGLAFSPAGDEVLSLIPWESGELGLMPVGPGERRRIDLAAAGIAAANVGSWSPDGQRIFLNADLHEGATHLFELEIATGAVRRIGAEPVAWGFMAVSPDGTRVAVQSADGRTVIYPVGGGEPTPVPGLEQQPMQWSDDGRYLFTYRFGQLPLVVDRVEIATGATEPFLTLTPTDTAGVVHISPVSLTRDGEQYVYGYPRRLSVLIAVEGME